jgi:hypothetical protein
MELQVLAGNLERSLGQSPMTLSLRQSADYLHEMAMELKTPQD